MPNVEHDEVDLLRLRKQDQTVSALWNNPKARRKIQEALKVVDPKYTAPELEAEEAVHEPIAKLTKQIGDLEDKLAAEKAENEKNAKLAKIGDSIEAGKQALRRAGYTDEGIAAVDKIMTEQGITNVEIAAAYYEKQHPPQSIATPGGSGAWNFVESVTDGEADLKKLIESKGESAPLVDRMVKEALTDIRTQSRR